MSPPQAIVHYRNLSKLGEGGMGIVYRATEGATLARRSQLRVRPDSARLLIVFREALGKDC